MNLNTYSFGEGLMQGFSFVESIRQSRQAQERADREEKRIEEDRAIAATERKRQLERQNSIDLAAAYDTHRATGKTFKDLSDDQKVSYFNARKAELGDDGTTVVGFKKNDDGTFTPLVTGRDKNGVLFNDPRPMTKQGTPAAEGGEEIRFSDDEATQMTDNWGGKYNGGFAQRAEKDAEIKRVKKEQDQDAIDVSTILRRKAPSTQAPAPQGSPVTQSAGTLAASEFDPLFEAAGKKYGIDPSLIKRYAMSESSLDPTQINDKDGNGGSFGLMQINGQHLPRLGLTPEQIMDPAANIDAGAAILADALKRAGGDKRKAAYYYKGATTPEGMARVDQSIARYGLADEPPVAQLASTDPQAHMQEAPAPAAAAPAAAAPPAKKPISVEPPPRRTIAPGATIGAPQGNTGGLTDMVAVTTPGPDGPQLRYVPSPKAMADKAEGRDSAQRWSKVPLADLQANPLKYIEQFNGDEKLKNSDAYPTTAKAIITASRDRIAELKQIMQTQTGVPAARARRELLALGDQLSKMNYSLSKAAGIPPRTKPGQDVVDAVKNTPQPPAKPDYGKDKSAVAAVTRGSERNRGSETPEITQREIDALGRLVSRKIITAEQAERYMKTGFLEKGEIQQFDMEKDIARVNPDGTIEIIRFGSPDPVKLAKAKADHLAAMTKEQREITEKRLARARDHFGNIYAGEKNKKLAEERYIGFTSFLLSRALDWHRYGLPTTTGANGDRVLDLSKLDESRFNMMLKAYTDSADEQDKFDNAGWFSLGGDKTAGDAFEKLPRETPIIQQKMVAARTMLKDAAANGNAEAQALLDGGDEAIYAELQKQGVF